MTVTRTERLTPDQQREVRTLARRVGAAAGSPPLNDETLVRLAEQRPGLAHLLLRDGDSLVGYAQTEGATAELAVPAEYAAELLTAVEDGASQLTLWTHGEGSTIAPLLDARGYRRVRVLHQLRVTLDVPPPELPLPEGVILRPFTVGSDEDAWLRVNAAAFAEYAEQGGWTREDLLAREAEEWFDPAGFFLAWRADELLGFHWTKVHPDGAGEVYVLGVDPAAQGLRLGAALLAIGLRHLAARGCPYVLLYVDDENATAMHLYERVGFRRHDLDAQWTRT